MNRRHFLHRNIAVLSAPARAERATPTATQQDPPETVSRYANKVLPTFASRLTSTLTPYAGAWGEAQAAHLLRRCLFGPTRGEIQTAAASSLTAVLNGLLTAPATPGPPLNVAVTDTTVPIGQTWVGQAFDQTLEGVRRAGETLPG